MRGDVFGGDLLEFFPVVAVVFIDVEGVVDFILDLSGG